MPYLILGRGINDEYEVSEFQEAAYKGNLQFIKERFASDPALLNDSFSLYLSLRGNRLDVFKFLILAGVTVTDSLYGNVLYEAHEWLQYLPPNEKAVRKATADAATSKLNSGLLGGSITVESVKERLVEGADVQKPLTYGDRIGLDGYKPIHLAARHPNLEIIKILLAAGADAEEVVSEGRNAVRIMFEAVDQSSDKRKELFRYFKNQNLRAFPPLTFWEKFNLARGKPLHRHA